MNHEVHPASARARLARRLRVLRHLRGWRRAVSWLVPAHTSGQFVVANGALRFAGDLASFIDRRTYLFGQYEERAIRLFETCVPRSRRGVILDVGANAGTHSLAFARGFARVHAFEPNAALWAQFERNVQLNALGNVTLHRVGLGDRDAELPLHAIDKGNHGLGTFATTEQYDLPLRRIGTGKVVEGDPYLASRQIAPVDAIKIDVQGFECAVLRGLRSTLARDQPIVWFELGARTHEELRDAADVHRFFPYAVSLLRIVEAFSVVHVGARLQLESGALPVGEYIAVPAPPAHS